MNKENLPAPVKEAIENFFTWSLDGKDPTLLIDNITQDALYNLKGKPDGESAGQYFFFMRNLKDLLSALKPYAE